MDLFAEFITTVSSPTLCSEISAAFNYSSEIGIYNQARHFFAGQQ